MPRLGRLTLYLMATGVHTLLVNGSMSGGVFLTDDEQMQALDTVLKEAGNNFFSWLVSGRTGLCRVPPTRVVARSDLQYLSILPPSYFFKLATLSARIPPLLRRSVASLAMSHIINSILFRARTHQIEEIPNTELLCQLDNDTQWVEL